MTIQANNETIKTLLHSNALTRNYLKEFEYELLVTIDNVEDFNLEYLCPFCDKTHNEVVKGIKLTNNKFILCTHPSVLMDSPILVLGFVFNHDNYTFNYTDMMDKIANIIVPSLDIEDMHGNTLYKEIISSIYSDSAENLSLSGEINALYNTSYVVHVN
jgi:hypothetical protein